jgi:hypothetical protein
MIWKLGYLGNENLEKLHPVRMYENINQEDFELGIEMLKEKQIMYIP